MNKPSGSHRTPTIVVVGAGFAGVSLVKGLRHAKANIVLIDRRNYHLFQPLLYQVAAAALSAGEIAYPTRRIFRRQPNVSVVLGEVSGIDVARQLVRLGDKDQRYDYLVLAAGSTHSFFGHDEWAQTAIGLKSIDDATEMRRRILTAFEDAEVERDDVKRRAKLTFVIVGGGPTGVELAGALREIAVDALQKDFRNIDTTTARILLFEANDRLLKAFPAALSERARQDLEQMGVDVHLNTRVTDLDSSGLTAADKRIDACNIFWAAGVQGSALGAMLQVELDRAGRVKVLPDLSVPGHPEIFVCGDLATILNMRTGRPVPGVAPAAIQMGQHVARCLRRELAHGATSPQHRKAFRYFDKGSLATIGKNKAVADIRGLHVSGFLAWCLWSAVHILFLVSYRSRTVVLLSWLTTYLFNNRPARLITGTPRTTMHTQSWCRSGVMPRPLTAESRTANADVRT